MANKITIKVGSLNEVKVSAVAEIIKDYPHLKHAKVLGVKADTKVSDQPKSLEETIEGAMNRAKSVFVDCDYAIGIESGLMKVLAAKGGYMDVCVCVIYDGAEYHLGLSSAWEFPDKRVTDMMIKEGLDMSQAINKAGLTNKPDIGSKEGAIGILTKGRMDRKAYTKQAIQTALIHLEKFDF
jgi:inosine/xanthosine triphosphatase